VGLATRTAVAAWLITAVYSFAQYTLGSADAVLMPELSQAFGVVTFLNLTFSALLGSVFGWILAAARDDGPSMALAHCQAAFAPLFYGAALAIVLTLLLKETGPAATPSTRHDLR
jgi:hypothetical protein